MALALLFAPSAGASWIVFARSGVQEIKGPIEVKGRQVLFHSLTGTLLSARLEDVDVPASAFLTWHAGDTKMMEAPSGPSLAPKLVRPPQATTQSPKGAPVTAPSGEPCTPAVVEQVVNAETLKVRAGGRLEAVHLACVDGPDLRHKFKDLDFYGSVALQTLERLAPAGSTICIAEDNPPRRDVEGHRLVFARSANGLDLGGEVVSRGLGLVRSETCSRAAAYRQLETSARVDRQGHWGPQSGETSLKIALNSMAMYGGPAPPPRVGGGGG